MVASPPGTGDGRGMRVHIARAALLACALLAAPPASAQNDNDRVLAVLERTKTTQATYANYIWNRVARLGEETVEEWSAEFHSGDLHRVETPRNRMIADCRALTGVAIDLETGERIEDAAVARVACGINTNRIFRSALWEREVETRFGRADRVQVVDDEFVRTYDVSSDGILLATTFAENQPDGEIVLAAVTVAVERRLPAADMFDEESLSRSYVPEQYRHAPTG